MDAETKAQLADVYEEAAKYLEKYGWTQYMNITPRVPTCFMGAIYSQTEDTSLYYEAADLVCEVLALEGRGPCTVGIWNDNPDRTKDEVINTLHALANKLR